MTAQPTHTSLDIFHFAKTEGELKGDLPIAQLTRLHPELTDTAGLVAYELIGEINAQKHPLIHIKADGSLHMTCQRCLEPITHTFQVDNTLHIVASAQELDSEEDELNAIIAGNAGFEKIVGSTQFDVLSLLEDEIILALPLSVMHDVCPNQLPSSSGQKASAFDVLAKLK